VVFFLFNKIFYRFSKSMDCIYHPIYAHCVLHWGTTLCPNFTNTGQLTCILSRAIAYSFGGNWSPWALTCNSNFDTHKILLPIILCTFFRFKKIISEVGHWFHVPFA